MIDFETARRYMVDNQLRTAGITDRRILGAMGAVPRERFVPGDRKAIAYVDTAHPLGGDRALGAPATVARLFQLAGIGEDDRVLDVGAGTGYSVAVLARLAGHVTGLERDAAMVATARANLAALGIGNADICEGPVDGAGLAAGPFDVIVLEGAVWRIPEPLLELLADGGRLVALVAGPGLAVAHLYVRAGNDVTFRQEFNSMLPPLVPGNRPQAFVF
jgi:protein-L-isoaspartate(D-aspartate) O-methyltransferase